MICCTVDIILMTLFQVVQVSKNIIYLYINLSCIPFYAQRTRRNLDRSIDIHST
jgi:hypothetical protein